MATTISDVLDGQLEAEKKYRQTLTREQTDESIRIDRLIKILERAKQLSHASRVKLSQREEMALRAGLESLANNPEWTDESIGELLRAHQSATQRSISA